MFERRRWRRFLLSVWFYRRGPNRTGRLVGRCAAKQPVQGLLQRDVPIQVVAPVPPQSLDPFAIDQAFDALDQLGPFLLPGFERGREVNASEQAKSHSLRGFGRIRQFLARENIRFVFKPAHRPVSCELGAELLGGFEGQWRKYRDYLRMKI
jgi:hypothetical protein